MALEQCESVTLNNFSHLIFHTQECLYARTNLVVDRDKPRNLKVGLCICS